MTMPRITYPFNVRMILTVVFLFSIVPLAAAQGPGRGASAQSAARANTWKPIASTRPLKIDQVRHLENNANNLRQFVMRVRDPHFDAAHPGSTPAFQLHAAAGGRLRLIRAANDADEYN